MRLELLWLSVRAAALHLRDVVVWRSADVPSARERPIGRRSCAWKKGLGSCRNITSPPDHRAFRVHALVEEAVTPRSICTCASSASADVLVADRRIRGATVMTVTSTADAPRLSAPLCEPDTSPKTMSGKARPVQRMGAFRIRRSAPRRDADNDPLNACDHGVSLGIASPPRRPAGRRRWGKSKEGPRTSLQP